MASIDYSIVGKQFGRLIVLVFDHLIKNDMSLFEEYFKNGGA